MDGLTASPRHRLFTLSFAALGVVYGDIGTSPFICLTPNFTALFINKVNLFVFFSSHFLVTDYSYFL